jgi:hypothetical protein
MARIIDNRDQLDKTVKIYDDFYNVKINIPPNEFDIVFAYFKGVCATNKIASNFTALLFRISDTSGINALEFLAALKGLPNKLKMNETMIFYLNTFRSRAALYGVGAIPKPVQPVARNIIQ